MNQRCEAVYEKGVFRPVSPVPSSLGEGQRVRLLVETVGAPDVLALAAQVYEGLSDDEMKDLEKIILDRRDFFERTTH